MVFNLSSSSSGQVNTDLKLFQKRQPVEKKMPIVGSGSAPRLSFAGGDSFEKTGESSTGQKHHAADRAYGSPGRGDELETFILNLIKEAKFNPELEVIPPKRTPGLNRSESFHQANKSLSGAWIEPELVPDPLTAPPKSLPGDVVEIPMLSRHARRDAMPAPLRPQSEVLISSREVPADEEPTQEPLAQLQQTERTETLRGRHHQSHRLSPEETHAALVKDREIAARRDAERVQSPAPTPGSHEEQVHLLKIPYKFIVLGRDQVASGIDAKSAASVMKEAHRFAVGDMHASFLKLVETLILGNLAKMPPADIPTFLKLTKRIDKYALRLDQIAKDQLKIDTALKEGQLTQEKFDEAREKLVHKNEETLDKLERAYWDMQQVVSRMVWTGGDRQIILVGDVVSDRGALDMVTLEILAQLTEQAPNGIKWMASNHDHNANSYITYGRDDVCPEQAVSMHRSFNLAERMGGKVELIGQYLDYLSNAQLMEFDASSGTLITHAPITEKQLKKLGSLLPEDVPKVDEIKNLAQVETFVKAAKKVYKDYIIQCQQQVMDKLEAEKTGKTPEHIRREIALAQRRAIVEPIFKDFVWARSAVLDIPFHRAGVKNLVHGHDMESKLGSPYSLYKGKEKLPDYSVATLDQEVRKGNSPIPEERKLSSLYILT